jgi:N-acetyl-gamma-glutamyl-phosphate reductase
MAQKKLRVGIVGASGYTGAELIRILKNHPNVQISTLVGDSTAGMEIEKVYPHLRGLGLPRLAHLQEVMWEKLDAAFFCLPHGASHEVIASVPRQLRIIDLSADFRIFNVDKYKEWYGKTHAAPELQKEAVYGLSEIFREPIKNARLLANPGCYPTSILLPLVPLLSSGLISSDSIIIDSKSGISGAGRSAKQPNLYTEVNENVRPYSIGGHRHLAEIEQTLSAASGTPNLMVSFTPQVVPISRGIISNIYAKLSMEKSFGEVRELLEQRYQDSSFVKLMPGDYIPTPRDVAGTNYCYMNVFKDRLKGRIVIVSVIDNLVKGASGQAVQNFNIMFGLPETSGLEYIPVFP